MNILMTGGTGFIGGALGHHLHSHGHRLVVLSRQSRQRAQASCPPGTRIISSFNDIADDEALDAVVNLAGESLFSRRWSAARKQRLLDSRVGVTDDLVALMRRLRRPPAVMVSGSAVGFYGDAGDAELTERSPARRKDFGYRLCDAWEQAAREVTGLGMRLVIVRTGVVLGANGGMLARLLPAYRFGLGMRLGSGEQWLSWIHQDDLLAILARALTSPSVEGVFNVTAPEPVTQREFHRALARAARRPAPWVMPAPVLRLALGEMSQLMLGGQRAYPRRLEEQGFVFRYPRLEQALADLV
ncbi:TIGR01777 family oxidoreductase [Alcanivorax sp. 24]|uniref:TIGR01777 family oxidoreductase n=1 Tax=Alcanivorax sp. 24 TaxID=2545266 RepID=UPI001060D20A|nr:TIGR01777 family oxidoreductase [Alcanivorax sp. 24]